MDHPCPNVCPWEAPCMPSRLAMPSEIAEVYFDFDWDKRKVWALPVEVVLIDRASLDWHLDLLFFSSRPPEPLFDLVPSQVIEDPGVHRRHARRIARADLRYPLDVMEHGSRLCILDGIHRLAKARKQEHARVAVRRVPRTAIPSILRSP